MPTDSTALATLLEHATAARDEATAQLYLMLEQVRRFSTQREQLHRGSSDAVVAGTVGEKLSQQPAGYDHPRLAIHLQRIRRDALD